MERTAEVPPEAERNRADHGPVIEERPGPVLATACQRGSRRLRGGGATCH